MNDNREELQKIEETARFFGIPTDFVKLSRQIRQAATMREKLDAFKQERSIIERGNAEAVKRQHEAGRLTARERIDRLLDPGSFTELDLWHRPYETGFDIGEGGAKGDGVIVGYGLIEGRPVTIWAQDAAVIGGTVGTVHARKIAMITENALNARTPLIGIFDSEGVRAHDAIQHPDFYSPGVIAFLQTSTSGVIPRIALVLGKCNSEMAVIAGLADFLFMVKDTSHMHLMHPPDGYTAEKLGDARNHSKVGNCDILAENEEDCLLKCRQLLSYLPSHNQEKPITKETKDEPAERREELLELVPTASSKVFDMYKLISAIVDDGQLFEIKRYFARNLITCFSRIGGRVVGIIASNPIFMGGCMSLDAADKMSRFVSICDAFNIPLIWLADTPAFIPAVDEERRGLIRHGSRMIMVNSTATVPRITISIRKHFGGGRLAMPGPTLASDVAVGWPTFEPGLMGAAGAVSIIYRKELEGISDSNLREKQEQKRIEEMQWSLDMQVREATQLIIDPRDTKNFLIRTLNWLQERTQELPIKKHDNVRM